MVEVEIIGAVIWPVCDSEVAVPNPAVQLFTRSALLEGISNDINYIYSYIAISPTPRC